MTVTRTIRLDDGQYAQIQAAAAADKRSVNGEIEWLLNEGLESRATGKAAGILPLPRNGPVQNRH